MLSPIATSLRSSGRASNMKRTSLPRASAAGDAAYGLDDPG
jgi:hypothetical protein